MVIATLLSLAAACGPPSEVGPADPTTGAPRATGSALGVSTLPTAAGESAEHVYDGAGNLLQIKAASAAALAITSFQPAQAGLGQVVAVAGSGFGPAPSLNAVTVNGVSASVLSATPTQLTFAVPAGATTGPIAVTASAGMVTSASPLTVIANVVVSDFTPKVGKSGTALTVSGFNFDATPSSNAVLVGTGAATVSTASTTSISATAGAAVTSGKVTVTTPSGTGTSSADFFVAPGSTVATNVAFTARATLGGPAVNVAIAQAGRAGLVLFDGRQGQFLSLYVSGVTFAGSTQVAIYTPSGTSLFSTSSVTSAQALKLVPPVLPSTGTYTVLIQPASGSSGQLSLRIFEDAAASLVAGGSASPLALAAGQNGRYMFTGTAGDHLGLAVTAIATSPSNSQVLLSLYQPNGTFLWSLSPAAPQSTTFPVLPATGAYTLLARPAGTASASISLLLSPALMGVLTIDGPATRFQTARPGQTGRYTFSATAGQSFTLEVITGATFTSPGGVSFHVYQPSGANVKNGSLSPNTDVKVDLNPLPASGTYTIELDPPSLDTGTIDVRVISKNTATLVPDDPPQTFTLGTAQNGLYTFTGNAGDYLGLAVTSLSTTPPGQSVPMFLYFNTTLLWNAAASVGSWQWPKLPVTGTYTFLVQPSGTAGATYTVQLSRALTSTIAVDGAPISFQNARPAQAGRYTFTGSVGDLLGFGATAFTSTPAGGSATVALFRPDGAQIWSTNVSGPTSAQPPALTTAGTHTLAVIPNGTSTVSVDGMLSHALTGALATNGTPTHYATTRPGQAAKYTFSGTAGQRFTVQGTASASYPTGLLLQVKTPANSTLASATLHSSSDVRLDLGALASTGAYSVLLTPSGVDIGSVDVRVIPYATGSFTVGAAAQNLNLSAAQLGRYTFSGTSGALINLVVSAVALTPSGGTLGFTIYNPAGNTFWSGNTAVPATWQIPSLTSTGTYTLALTSPGTAAASTTVQLVTR
jgi:hypothetical protein